MQIEKVDVMEGGDYFWIHYERSNRWIISVNWTGN